MPLKVSQPFQPKRGPGRRLRREGPPAEALFYLDVDPMESRYRRRSAGPVNVLSRIRSVSWWKGC